MGSQTKRTSGKRNAGGGERGKKGVGAAKPAAHSTMEMAYCEVGARPGSDSGYFEQMSRTIFSAGLNWRVVDGKWPNFRRAFSNFSPEKVARYDDAKVQELLEDKGIVRNRGKILATINNAKEFVAIRKQQGSFDAYLGELRRLPEEQRCRILAQEFAHLGPSTAVTFLRAVGEEMPEMSRKWMGAHGPGAEA